MSEVDIPWNEWSAERLRSGDKTATTRTSVYGQPGDTFTEAGKTFKLTHVVAVPLEVVSANFYEEEGANTPDEFIEVWEDIHYRKGFVPEWVVHLHLFTEVDDA